MKFEKAAKTAWMATSLIVVIFVVGFWFDTDSNATILGKYSIQTLVKLGLITVGGYFSILMLRFIMLPQTVQSDGKKRIIPLHTKIFLIIVTFSLGFMTIEGMLQWKLHKNLKKEFVKRQQKTGNFDPFLQVVPKRNDAEMHINRWGFRGEEIERTKPAGTYRIFVVGGSTVLSSRVDFEQSHVRILEKQLRKNYPALNIEVQNAGMHWHTSQHSLMKVLFNIQDFNLDMIIVFHAINDLYRSCISEEFTQGPYRNDYSHYLGPVAPMVREYFGQKTGPVILTPAKIRAFFRHHWFSDLRNVSKQTTNPILSEVPVNSWPSLPAFERNMDNLAMLAEALDIDLVMASQPYLYRHNLDETEFEAILFPGKMCGIGDSQPDIPSMIEGMRAFNETSKRIADAHGILFVDLEKFIPKSLDYFLDDVHYTEKGNQAVADLFGENIIASGYISRKSMD